MALRTVAGFSLVASAAAASIQEVSAFVQASVQAHQMSATAADAVSTLGHGRLQMLARAAATQLPDLQKLLHPKFDCDKYPAFCKEPFNCQDWSPVQMASGSILGWAADGKANLATWCMAPQYEPYVDTCLNKKDLVKAGQIQYKWSIDQHNGVDELDGSYCFLEGHCTNLAVTNSTTLEESYKMCDDRYGHDGWTKFGTPPTVLPLMTKLNGPGMSPKTGFHDPTLTQAFLKAACAMGNYHCDVMYCKETYCKEPYYVQKYSHLLPKAPGHLIQQRESVL